MNFTQGNPAKKEDVKMTVAGRVNACRITNVNADMALQVMTAVSLFVLIIAPPQKENVLRKVVSATILSSALTVQFRHVLLTVRITENVTLDLASVNATKASQVITARTNSV